VNARIETVAVSSFRIPTDAPESDGTYEWDATTMVLVEIAAGGARGIGFTYEDRSCATLIRDRLAPLVEGCDAFDIEAIWRRMLRDVRNLGSRGIAACAISAIDNALWDLKAKLLALPLVRLLGQVREEVPVYGSGGFTSYDDTRLRQQLGGWSAGGFRFVKIKVGRDAKRDVERVALAREAIGNDCALFVDANGAYTRKQALAQAEAFASHGVTWFEEPVSSDDLEGLRLIRDRAPAGMDITAGEYGYDLFYFRRVLESGAVDILQADATRCCGITGFLKVAALCDAFQLPLSSHCAPSMHLHAGCALPRIVHLEFFHDHARIESMLFDGFVSPVGGMMRPDLTRHGHGLELKKESSDAFRLD
jgi:L-alanine-DL-glutamate epimerase-like enolase superfamily enzyme